MKIYFKKLGKDILFCIIAFLFQYLTSNIVFTLTGLIIKNEELKYFSILLIPVFIMILYIHRMRINKYDEKLKYYDSMKEKNFSLHSDISSIVNNFEFRMGIAAFSTLMLPLFFILLSSVDELFIFEFIAGIITFGIIITIYTLIDLTSWHFVHKNWINQRITNNDEQNEI